MLRRGPSRAISLFGWELLGRGDTLFDLWKACIAECLGTLLFVFIATGVVTSGCHTSDVANQSGNAGDTSLKNAAPGSCFLSSTSTLLNIALAFGFGLFAAIYFTASFSGGHINPAVTTGMFVARRISFVRGILYVIVQCGGAAAASIILKGLDPTGYKAAAGASNQVSGNIGLSGGQALGFEIIGTFALVFTVFAATDPARAVSTAPLPILAPFAIGMVLFIDHLMLIPIDGCSVNPARSFGPAVVSQTFNHYWIFWVGPLAGGIGAALTYEFGFRESAEQMGAKVKDSDSGDVESGIPVNSKNNDAVYTGNAGLQNGG